MGKKIVVDKTKYLQVLIHMDVASIAIALNGGLKLDDIETMELYMVTDRKPGQSSGHVKVYTGTHQYNLAVRAHMIVWD
jgi:hypothetical protein